MTQFSYKHLTPSKIKTLYENGHNISAIMRKQFGLSKNTEEIIEIAYDIQAGSYISAMEIDEYRKKNKIYCAEIAKTIQNVRGGERISILEAGLGEATTLSGVLKNIGSNSLNAYGFDLSWSRIACARKWLQSQDISGVSLCTGSLLHIPFADNSIDIVYTSHSIEPNGGKEEPILRELYRVARNFLILLEPSYELGNETTRKRNESHGYCKNLNRISESLGYKVTEHKLLPVPFNPLNPTAITVIRKGTTIDTPENKFVCPKFKSYLERKGEYFYSPEALAVYPIINGIPCLRIENAILASKFVEIAVTE